MSDSIKRSEDMNDTTDDNNRNAMRIAAGAHNLAHEMGSGNLQPIFRRFENLMILDLLILQEEVEREWSRYLEIAEPAQPPPSPEKITAVPQTENEVHEEEEKKAALLKLVRDKFKEYSRYKPLPPPALDLQSLMTKETAFNEATSMLELDPPNHRELRLLRQTAGDAPTSSWSKANEHDLVSLQAPLPNDNRTLDMYEGLYAWLTRDRRTNKHSLRETIDYTRKERRQNKRTQARRQAFWSRLFMAYFGAYALMFPIWMLSLSIVSHWSLVAQLGVVMAFTSAFALLLVFGAEDSTGKDVLAATAAYTAVLVVFLAPQDHTAPDS